MTASRFVPYKRLDLIARAFASLPDRRLVIVGDGPDAEKIRAAAGPNVTLVGARVASAFALSCAAREHFCSPPTKISASRRSKRRRAEFPSLLTDVVARSRRFADASDGAPTGVFFTEQTTEAIARAVRELEGLPAPISPADCRLNAERFSEERFRREFAAFVEQEWLRFGGATSSAPSGAQRPR